MRSELPTTISAKHEELRHIPDGFVPGNFRPLFHTEIPDKGFGKYVVLRSGIPSDVSNEGVVERDSQFAVQFRDIANIGNEKTRPFYKSDVAEFVSAICDVPPANGNRQALR